MKRIEQKISEQEIIDLIVGLVSIPSHPGIKNQETAVAEYIHDFFTKEGIESKVIPIADGRCNVIARLKGKGGGRSLMLNGHTDTEPPFNMDNPFKVKVRNGKLFGRGVVDMKGALACMMIAMAAIKRAGIKLKGDLIFTGVIDEECNSKGLINLLKSDLKVDAAIVGEPTSLDMCIGHRGVEWLEFYFRGKTVHGGAQKEGINAISKAAKFIYKLERKLLPEIEKRKHPIIGESSMNYGFIKGGDRPSTVAGECILQLDRRWVPSEEYTEIIKEYQDIIDALHAEDPDFICKMKVMDSCLLENGYVHKAMEIDLNHPLVKTLERSIINTLGEKPIKRPFNAWTDAGLLYGYANIPTIVFGPGGLDSAHSPGEFLEISHIKPASLIYAQTAVEYCEL